jgi:ADP-heptose:LPS heptosyltransferase
MRSLSLWKYRLKFLFKLWGYEILDQWIIASVPYKTAKKVLVFRLDLIGDYLLTRPFFPDLNKWANTQSKSLYFAGNQQVKSLAEELDAANFQGFYWIDRPRFINSIFYRYRVLKWVRIQGFSEILYPSHTRQYWLESVVKVSGCRNAYTGKPIGKYMAEWEMQTTNSLYRAHLETGPEPIFEFYRNQNFFGHFFASTNQIPIRDGRFQNKQKRQHGQPFQIVLATGASTSDRKWPLENFIQLMGRLADQFHIMVVLMGSQAESKEAEKLKEALFPLPVENACGVWSLVQSMEHLSQADLLVSNESAPVHMAATTGTPCVCISQGNHFGRWNPYPEDLAPRVYTVYPKEFGDISIRFEELAQSFGHGSRIPMSHSSVRAVFEVCIQILTGEASQSTT